MNASSPVPGSGPQGAATDEWRTLQDPVPDSADAGRIRAAASQAVLDALPAHICVLDLSGTVVTVNRAWRDFALENGGTPQHTGLGMSYLRVCETATGPSAEVGAAVARALREFQSGARDGFQLEYECHAPDVRRWFVVRISRLETGGAERLVVAHEDVTPRGLTRLALLESEARYRTLLESMADGVFVAEGSRFVFANPGLEAMLGYAPGEFVGLPFHSVIDPEFLPFWTQQYRERMGDGAEPERHFEVRFLTKGGAASLWVDLRACRLDFRGHRSVLGIVQDISPRKRSEETLRSLEARLRAAAKMEAMGRMANAVAHDFNNALTAIRTTAELLRQPAIDGRTLMREVDDVLGAVDRAAGLTADLLTFGRRQHREPRLTAPGKLLGAARTLAERVVPAGIALEQEIRPGTDETRIRCDIVQLEQVLVHLLENAADAMPSGGVVRMRCGTEHVAADLPHRYGVVAAGDYVTFRVEDTGRGMTEDELERLFEPFFTTKPQGRGTGLSLATTYGIVQQAGGAVVVETSPAGSHFTVYWPLASERDGLPAAPEAPTPVGTAPPAAAPERTAPAMVLVVDDEDVVRRTTARALERQGYRVVTAASAGEAIALLREAQAEVDVLVTDVRMPEQSGVELVAQLVTDGLDLPVLFLSGQLDAPLPSTWPSPAPRRFLRKPFTLAELQEAVHGLLPVA